MVYCASRFKPKKKRKLRGVIAEKYNNNAKMRGFEKEKLLLLEYNSRMDDHKYMSLETNLNYTERKEILKYTGTLVKGIATMHKSNAVPVINQEQMEDISRMRRG